MERTEILDLPLIMPSQAQKHVTHNEALRALDALVQLTALDFAADAPADPQPGDRYIVADAASGSWAGRDGHVAAFQDGAWFLYEPGEGWLCTLSAPNRLLVRRQGAWADAPVPRTQQNLERLGVNASASATNRVTVAAEATLLTAETGDHRLTINRNGAGDTASLVFQSGYSGRAELGLAGREDLTFKLSADGSAWTDALIVRADGTVALAPLTIAALPASADAGSLAFVTDGPDGATLALNDGSSWRALSLGPTL